MWSKNFKFTLTASLNDKLKEFKTKLDIPRGGKKQYDKNVQNQRWLKTTGGLVSGDVNPPDTDADIQTEQRQPHWWNETPWSLTPCEDYGLGLAEIPRCWAPLGGLPVEEGCVSSEGWEAAWPSLSPSESRWVLTKPGMAWGSTGCRSCWIWRFLAVKVSTCGVVFCFVLCGVCGEVVYEPRNKIKGNEGSCTGKGEKQSRRKGEERIERTKMKERGQRDS